MPTQQHSKHHEIGKTVVGAKCFRYSEKGVISFGRSYQDKFKKEGGV